MIQDILAIGIEWELGRSVWNQSNTIVCNQVNSLPNKPNKSKSIKNPISFFDDLYLFFQRLRENHPEISPNEISKKFVALSGDWAALETHLRALKEN